MQVSYINSKKGKRQNEISHFFFVDNTRQRYHVMIGNISRVLLKELFGGSCEWEKLKTKKETV